jgi:prefoldin subunit 5
MKEPLDCKTARLYYRKKSRLQRYEDALLLVTKNIEKLENRIVSLDDRLNEISKQHNSAVM